MSVTCPVCEAINIHEYSMTTGDRRRFDCRRCGEFDASRTALATLNGEISQGIHRRALMSHAIRRMGKSTGSAPMITTHMFESFWPSDRLPAPGKQSNDLVLFAGDNQLSHERPVEVASFFLDAWLGTSLLDRNDPHSGTYWICNQLKFADLLTWSRHQATSERDEMLHVQLTMAGWGKYEELQKVRTESRTAFMAMKFGDPQLDGFVETVFKPAVKRTGFELRKLTDEQPAGLIDDQIRSAILSGRFVIADLTHGSYGAYWEAGFAEGLNLPVIYTCEKSAWEEKKTHFDTNHLLTIVWDAAKPKEAGDALTATIRATLRTEARQQDVFD